MSFQKFKHTRWNILHTKHYTNISDHTPQFHLLDSTMVYKHRILLCSMTTDDVRVYQAPPVTASIYDSGVTSHGDVTPSRHLATSGFQTLTPADASPHWLNTLYTRYVIASTSGMTSQRWHLVTRAWPISRSEWMLDLTYIQVRVIDWHVTVLVTGHLAADGGTSGVTSHGDVTEATPVDVTGSTSYHVTPSRPIRSLENIQNGEEIQAALYTTDSIAGTGSFGALKSAGRGFEGVNKRKRRSCTGTFVTRLAWYDTSNRRRRWGVSVNPSTRNLTHADGFASAWIPVSIGAYWTQRCGRLALSYANVLSVHRYQSSQHRFTSSPRD